MKILYLAHRIPYPPNKGDKIRSFNEIKYLSRLHTVDLTCLADQINDVAYENDLKKYCNKVFVDYLSPIRTKWSGILSFMSGKAISVGYFYKKSVQAVVDQWLSETQYDAIICFSSSMAEYVFCNTKLGRFVSEKIPEFCTNNKLNTPKPANHNPLLLMDFCDVDSDKWRQYAQKAKFPFNIIYSFEYHRFLEYEKKINRAFNHSVFVSEKESELFLSLYPQAKNLCVISNGVDYNYFSPHRAEKLGVPSAEHIPKNSGPVLVFTGAMDYHANVDGVLWFSESVLPEIKKEFPKTLFIIAGSNPHPKVQKLSEKGGIIVTGFVRDIRPYYQAADVFVAPLRLARGVQNKVLEAMSMEKAVVATSAALSGISANNGEHVLIADSPRDFFNGVLHLIKNKSAGIQLKQKAREFIVDNYSWDLNLNLFDKLLTSNG